MFQREKYGLEDFRIGGFVGLMDLYENNFIRLRKLIPDISAISTEACSYVDGCHELYLTVVDHGEFTSTLNLTYHFCDKKIDRVKISKEPNLRLRVYHDACLVEAISGHLQHGKLVLSNLPKDALREKWKLNRFLNKWLGFCLFHGHGFDAQRLKTASQVRKLVRKITD